MVSASTGVMNSLLGKLATLMGEEFAKLKHAHDAAVLHKCHLENEVCSLTRTLTLAYIWRRTS
mgnify:CR=1 FL=1